MNASPDTQQGAKNLFTSKSFREDKYFLKLCQFEHAELRKRLDEVTEVPPLGSKSEKMSSFQQDELHT
jgi:hypothetical protein